MLNLQKLVIDRFAEELQCSYVQTYGDQLPMIGRTAAWCGKLALENIANSDALYHNIDHTVLVTMVGQTILQGKHLSEGGVSPQDWLHFTLALLCHDIGFVRGICRQDNGIHVATGIGNCRIAIPRGATDAMLAPHHLDRSKLFVSERFNQPLFLDIDVEEVNSYIEMSRFPIPDDPWYRATDTYGGLVRAADFIGQLGDPNYLRKLPALYYELKETDGTGQPSYDSLEEMRANYARFYWDVVSPYIQDALRYLRLTQEGKQWVANLHAQVFDVEHSFA